MKPICIKSNSGHSAQNIFMVPGASLWFSPVTDKTKSPGVPRDAWTTVPTSDGATHARPVQEEAGSSRGHHKGCSEEEGSGGVEGGGKYQHCRKHLVDGLPCSGPPQLQDNLKQLVQVHWDGRLLAVPGSSFLGMRSEVCPDSASSN